MCLQVALLSYRSSKHASLRPTLACTETDPATIANSCCLHVSQDAAEAFKREVRMRTVRECESAQRLCAKTHSRIFGVKRQTNERSEIDKQNLLVPRRRSAQFLGGKLGLAERGTSGERRRRS